MEQVSQQSLDKFKSITKIDAVQYFQNFVDFIEIYYPRIVEYYDGTSKTVNSAAFDTFKKIKEQTKRIIDQFISNELALSNYEFWIMLEQVEDIQSQLDTTDNLARWLRSNKTNNGFISTPRIPYVAKQGESLENIESNVLGSSNPNEDWVNTALQNNLREEDYTLEGGYLIKAEFKNNASITLQSVVDSVDTIQKSYGLDIDKRLTFIDNDLKTLNYKETLFQSALINSSLKKGDNPVAPNDGINEKASVGGTSVGISYPTIFRDMAAVFAKDDTFKSFAVTDVRKDQDAIFIDYTLETRAGDILNRTTKI